MHFLRVSTVVYWFTILSPVLSVASVARARLSVFPFASTSLRCTAYHPPTPVGGWGFRSGYPVRRWRPEDTSLKKNIYTYLHIQVYILKKNIYTYLHIF